MARERQGQSAFFCLFLFLRLGTGLASGKGVKLYFLFVFLLTVGVLGILPSQGRLG
jgi:hypothetical protein